MLIASSIPKQSAAFHHQDDLVCSQMDRKYLGWAGLARLAG